MNIETITPEVVAPEQAQLVAVVAQNNLPAEAAQNLQASFAPLFRSARDIVEQSRNVTVTDASQVAQIRLSRAFRLELRKVRVAGETLRKQLKEESLRRGKAIDGFNAILLDVLSAEENRLEEQEKIVERQEAARKAALKADRETALATYGVDTAFLSLGEMPDATFAQLLENTRAGYEVKLEAARKAEFDRIAAENARLKEEARIREENDRLKREADAKEAALRVERAAAAERAAEDKRAADEMLRREREAAAEQAALAKRVADEFARTQREAAAAAEAELKAQREQARKEHLRLQALAEVERQKAAAALNAEKEKTDAAWRAADAAKKVEHDRIAAEQVAARQAAAAPDKDKLISYANAVRALELPKFSTEAAKSLASTIEAQREKFALWIEEKRGAL